MALPNDVIKPIARRACKPKVRSGCKTCKIRRVKCDEGRPSCKRCIKFGVACDGYLPSVDSSSFSSTTPTRRNILPKPSKLCELSPLPRRFESEQESRFFRFFCDDVAAQLGGPLRTTLWERIVPQMCEAEPFVRHAVVSIGALSQLYRDHDPRHGKGLYTFNHRTHEFEDRKHLMYEFALKEYAKALKGMRKAIANRKHDIRNALIACLLVFCLESLQGNPNSAVSNAKSGLTLFYEFMATKNSSCTMTQGGASYAGIEADILKEFGGLDLQVLFFLDGRSDDVHRAAVARFEAAVNRMPNEFETLEDSMTHWRIIQRRNYHFNIIAINALSNLTVSAGSKNPLHNASPFGTSEDINSVSENVFPSPPEDSELARKAALRDQMERYREDLRRWLRASGPIFDRVDEIGGKEQSIIMKLTKIHYNLNHIQLAGAFFVKETEFDAYLPEYTTIVELSEEVYPYLTQNSNSVFRFFLGIVYALSAVGFRCRDSHIRGRAIALLQRGPYREGIWDALGVGKLTDWIRRVEEEGIDENGYIPDSKRAVCTLCDVDLKAKVAVLGCVSSTEDGLKFRKEVVSWDHEICENDFGSMKLKDDTKFLASHKVLKDGSSVSGGPLRFGKFWGDEAAYEDGREGVSPI